MRGYRALLSAVVSAAFVVGISAAPASAATIVYTYHGRMEDGYKDTFDAFGLKGAALDGKLLTVVFTFDTDAPPALRETQAVAGTDKLSGGPGDALITNSGFASPLVDATLTINGQTKTFTGAAFSGVGDVYQLENESSAIDDVDTFLDVVVFSLFVPANVETPFDGTGAGGGDFAFTQPGALDADGDPMIETGFFELAAPAPEPGVWALILSGVGAMGSALRIRRRRAGLVIA